PPHPRRGPRCRAHDARHVALVRAVQGQALEPRAPPRRPAAGLLRPAGRPLDRADPYGDQRDGGEHQRHRLLRARRPAHLRHPRDVVGHHPARRARLLAQRAADAGRAPDPALASRLPGKPAGGRRGAALMLTVEGLSKAYGDMVAIARMDFTVDAGEFVCIVGPSGCGKTTLLKCVGGLLAPSTGRVMLHGEQVLGPPRQMALVFQDYSRSLLPWMSVQANVALPLHARGLSGAEQRTLVSDALASVGLEGFERHYPWQLSGGMQQRVAMARALAYQPEILLMDEPFASVDAQTRSDLEDLLLAVWRRLRITVLFVTHDIDESVYLADRVIVLGPRPTKVDEILPV